MKANIFKSTPGGSIKRSLPTIPLDRIIGFVQSKALIDYKRMTAWYNSVVKHYNARYNGCTGLLLDHPKHLPSKCFTPSLKEDNVQINQIPIRYTSLLQPCDASIC